MARVRRRPGAQPGNRNAVKHGFYARNLTDSLREAVTGAFELEATDLTGEIAIARAKLMQLLDAAPENIDALTRIVDSIARLAATHARLNASDEGQLQQAMLAELDRMRQEVFA